MRSQLLIMILTLLRRLALRGVPQHRLLKGGLPLLLDSTAVQDLVRKRGSASRREAPTSRDAARRARVTTRIRIRARTRARAITRERARIGAITPVRARMTYWSCWRKSAVSDIRPRQKSTETKVESGDVSKQKWNSVNFMQQWTRRLIRPFTTAEQHQHDIPGYYSQAKAVR